MMHLLSFCLYSSLICSLSALGNVQQNTNGNEDLEKIVDVMLGQKLAIYDAKYTEMKQKLDYQEFIIADLQDKINHGIQSSSNTLFLASVSAHYLPFVNGDIVIWDTDRINPGGHYNTATGGYTAPFDGYYQFTVAKTSYDNAAEFYLLVDDERILDHDLNNLNDQAPSTSTTINIQLTAGQVVRVENIGNGDLVGTNSAGFIWSWFTGYMLYLL